MLVRLTDVDVPEPQQAFAERLSLWLGWADAISLSAALNGTAAAPSGAGVSASAEEAEYRRVRNALIQAIAQDSALRADDAGTDFSAHRRRYLARQQAMEASIGALRGRLRTALAARSPEMARLAAVDAVMDQALGAQERNLLATVPGLLEKRFERLRHADGPEAWLSMFCKDMQAVLLAELDLRLQPAAGLIAALSPKVSPPP